MLKNGERLDDLQNGLFIIQKKEGFKFGTDAVLLADFARNVRCENMIDLCTGTGIVPLLMSAKTRTEHIHGLEIQSDMAEMAARSVEYNGLTDRIQIKCGDLKDAPDIYGVGAFDCVTCNPPYMKRGAAIENGTDALFVSRHEVLCTLEDVVASASRLLRSKGRFFMVHRPSRLTDIICAMRAAHVEPKRMRLVCPAAEKPPSLLLIEGMKDGGSELKIAPPLFIYGADGKYSSEINKIYERNKEE